MFGRGMYFSLFYCVCYFNVIGTDMSEEHVSEEIDPDLNEEEDIRMGDSQGEH